MYTNRYTISRLLISDALPLIRTGVFNSFSTIWMNRLKQSLIALSSVINEKQLQSKNITQLFKEIIRCMHTICKHYF